MIIGRKRNKTEETVALLEQSPFSFHPTGSRFFGNIHGGSDWDFYTEYDLGIETWLKMNRFLKLRGPGDYGLTDPNIAIVYEKGDVQVQLVKDAELKRRAQDLLDSMPYAGKRAFFSATKVTKKFWWEWAYQNLAPEEWEKRLKDNG